MSTKCERTDCLGAVVGNRPVSICGAMLDVPLCREHFGEWARPVVEIVISCTVGSYNARGTWTRPGKRWSVERVTNYQGRRTEQPMGRFATCAAAEARKALLERLP
jgi:hypothetical protein